MGKPAQKQPLMLSIILPVFNVSSCIRQCLESIINQHHAYLYEIILIDDCSTDQSLKVCQTFTDEYPGIIKLIGLEDNQGVSVARNYGLDVATGTYVMFVDPDDILPPSAILNLIEAAEKYQADIVKGNLFLFHGELERPARDRVKKTSIILGDNILTTLYEHKWVRGHVGGKLFRRKNLGDIRLAAGVRVAEDLLYFSEMFSRAKSFVLIDKDVYRYRKDGTGSTGRKYEKGSYIDWLAAVEKSGQYARNKNQKRAHISLMLRTLGQIAREARRIDKHHAREVLDVIEQTRQNWGIRFPQLLFKEKLDIFSILRYLKMKLALYKIKRNLQQST